MGRTCMPHYSASVASQVEQRTAPVADGGLTPLHQAPGVVSLVQQAVQVVLHGVPHFLLQLGWERLAAQVR
jgi:hypothetical protein